MNSSPPNLYDYGFYSLLKFLWLKKVIVIAIPSAIGVLVALWTLTLKDTYLSDTTLSPTEEVQGAGLGSVSGQLGGLASLAGISLGGESTDQVTVALEIMKSRQFLANFINSRGLKPQVMAVDGWDYETGELQYDIEKYNPETGEWLREVKNGRPPTPTDQEVYERFIEMILIERDTVTGLVKVSIEYYSPIMAQQWLTMLIESINKEMREREIKSASENIQYLDRKVADISDIEMKSVFFQLIQEQTKNLMLAELRSEYVFTVIDPPIAPELKFAPKRSLIVIFVGLLSGFLTLGGLVIWFIVVPRE